MIFIPFLIAVFIYFILSFYLKDCKNEIPILKFSDFRDTEEAFNYLGLLNSGAYTEHKKAENKNNGKMVK